MPKKYCTASGCNSLIDIKDKYCSNHSNSNYNKSYDKLRSKDKHRSFIRSDRWKRIRLKYLQTNPICELCNEVQAVLVDHITERKDGGCVDCIDNLQSLCQLCHNRKSRDVNKARLSGTLEEYYNLNNKTATKTITLAG